MTFIDRARAFIGLAEPVPSWPPERLSLALRGGGSFGAFTWGVLDRLLEEPAICRKLRLPAGPTGPLLSSKQIAPTERRWSF